MGQLREGIDPDDLIKPKSLAPLARTSLKEAFRAVARVQRGVANEYGLQTHSVYTAPKPVVARGAVHRDGRRDNRERPATRRNHLVRRHPDRVLPDHRVGVGSRSRASAGHVHERGPRDPPPARGGPRRAPSAPEALAPLAATDARADPGGACQLGGAHVSAQGRVPPAAPVRGHGGPVAAAERRGAASATRAHAASPRSPRRSACPRIVRTRPRGTRSPPRRPSSPWRLTSRPAATGPCAR